MRDRVRRTINSPCIPGPTRYGRRVSSSRFLLSPLLSSAGFRHAFFTRSGGVSAAPFDSLSFSVSVGDEPAAVQRNLAIAAADLGVDPGHIFYLDQVHSALVLPATRHDDAASFRKVQGDAVVSADPTVACGARTADCAPVLVADRISGAAVAIHSGWKSTAQDIVAAGVNALRDLAAGRVDLIAAIGPHIEACCFEVGDDVAAVLAAASPDHDVVAPGPRGRPHVDLRRVIRAQLLRAGVAAGAIDDVRGCSVCDRERFFSYRRDGARSGRMLAAIVPRSGQAS